MLITIERSAENEATAYPYWLIIDPRQMMAPSVDAVAGMVVGPFFSRQEAEDELTGCPHRYSKRARVYCHSGHRTRVYRDATNMAVKGGDDRG